MELPFNTVYTKELGEGKIHVADWPTKRDWNQFAFEELAKVGYEISSAYTMVKKDKPCKFVYRDSVWQGTDMLGTGVASFGHMSHVHIQNTASWDKYVAQLKSGELPLSRAFLATDDERLTREMILQLKLGKISTEYFQEKFGSDIQSKFSKSYQKLELEGMVTLNGREIKLTPKGLLQVDSLLPEFYEEKYQNSRYT